MSDWQSGNEKHLSAALAWLRLRLSRLAEETQESRPTNEVVAEAEINQAAAAMAESEQMEPPPALLILSQRLGLSRFEQEVLLLCAAMELDTRIAALCARAQGDPQRLYPTFSLALTLFDDPAWDVLSPERPLRYWQLIEINQPGATPLTTSPLRADERIVNYLKGLNYLDDRLMHLLIPMETADIEVELPPSQQTIVETIVNRLQQIRRSRNLPIIQLLGSDTASKQLVAGRVANELGLTLFRLPAHFLPKHTAELERLIRLWQRESVLMPVALYLDAQELGETESGGNEAASWLNRFLIRSNGLYFLDIRDVWPDMDAQNTFYDVSKPTRVEQEAAWAATLGPGASESPALLAGQFNLSAATIQRIVEEVLALPPSDNSNVRDLLWDACLVRTRPRLDLLAQRLDPRATWSDIVLPEEQLDLLRQIASQVRQRSTVYEEWGFRHKLNRGLGIMALFAGESGTGKTMAAEVIANDLNLNLYRIDLSGVVSKYIGETEKNLRRLFDAAEDGGAILFFDEADALFGKRTQVRDSHDRYANIEINYLLQRMEAYQGLAILSTNRKSDLDDAFVRRLRFIATFPFPEMADRKRIWNGVFPPETPMADLDFDRLARFKLTGGSIQNIALNAAFLAAQAAASVTMPIVLEATRAEFLKMDRLINEDDFH